MSETAETLPNGRQAPLVPLAKNHLAALRMADRVVFQLRGGTSSVRAVKDAGNGPDPFGQVGREVCIPAGTCVVLHDPDVFGRCVPDAELPGYQGFTILYSSSGDRTAWQTIAGALHPGDLLILKWERDRETTMALRKAGIVADSLYLEAVRPGKTKDRQLTWLLDVKIDTGDSQARMVRKT